MRLNGGQKAVVCVGFGAVLVVFGFAARAWWWPETVVGGWFNYAPNNGVVYTWDGPDGGRILAEAAAWIGLVVVWTAVSLLITRTRTASPGEAPPTP